MIRSKGTSVWVSDGADKYKLECVNRLSVIGDGWQTRDRTALGDVRPSTQMAGRPAYQGISLSLPYDTDSFERLYGWMNSQSEVQILIALSDANDIPVMASGNLVLSGNRSAIIARGLVLNCSTQISTNTAMMADVTIRPSSVIRQFGNPGSQPRPWQGGITWQGGIHWSA